MASHVTINQEYPKQELADLFAASTKTEANNSSRLIADLGENAFDSELLAPLFRRFTFVPKNDNSVELCQFVDNTRPHINPGNTGLVIFPVSGSLTLNTYSYVTPTSDANGRPTMDFLNMSDVEIAEIEATKTESVVIDSPMAIDGLTTFSLHPTQPDTVVLVLKIDMLRSWESVTTELTNL